MNELKEKFIIHNYSDLSDIEVMVRIEKVMMGGKISKTKAGEQYCFVSVFKDGITISCGRRGNTYTFFVERRKINE